MQQPKPGYLFASAMLVILLGIIAGWGWRHLISIPGITSNTYIAQVAPTVKPMQAIVTPTAKLKPSPTAKVTRTPTPIVNLSYKQNDTGSRLLIPSIGLDAAIEAVGVTSDGSLDVPKFHPWDGVGLYRSGTMPGELGSAVIDGHLDRPGGGPAVFWNLRNVKIGDYVLVRAKNGHEQRFRVENIRSYTTNQAPTESIFGDNSNSYLNLITCDATWSAEKQDASQRLVVHTVLEN